MSSAAYAYPQKSAEAFRTISEVALELDVPQHVLRFWESRFVQIKPIKRAGGRRFARGRMAVERGELEGNCASWSALPPEWMVGQKVNVFTRFSTKRPSDMPENIPYIGDLTKDEVKKELIAVLNAPGELGRPFVLAKQVPDERVTMLRTAFASALRTFTSCSGLSDM